MDGTTTYGTLEVPDHRPGQRLAAALLLPGSGPTDRDGNEAGTDVTPATLKLLADLLARQGIMTLRFDKYFSGRTGAGTFAADPASFTIDGDEHQVDAAYAFLARQPAADPARLLVVGHSEGGMLALQVAATTATPPAGLALLEPQDERALDLIALQLGEQVDALVAQGRLSSATGATDRAALAQCVADFRAGRPVSTAELAAPIATAVSSLLVDNAQPAYLRSWDLVRPTDLATQVERGTRVLVTVGSRDTNVPPSTIGPLVAALRSAGTTGPGLRPVTGTDHFMHLAGQSVGDPVLAPAVVAEIRAWARPYAS